MDNNITTNFQLASYVYYTFLPLIIVILVLTIGSNLINIFMITKVWKKCTSLNISFANISSFNFLLVYNQIVLLVLIIQQGTPIPPQICYPSLLINSYSSFGIVLTHLFLAWDRHRIAQAPTKWKQNQFLALIFTATLWIGIGILAVYGLLLDYRDVTGDIKNCFTVSSVSFHIEYIVALQVLKFLIFIGLSIIVYVYHVKTITILKNIDHNNASDIQENSAIAHTDKSRRQSAHERAIRSILQVYTLHLASQLLCYAYNLVQYVSTSPLPRIIITNISFLTALSPLLMLLNNRYKQNVKLFFGWICGRRNQRETYLQRAHDIKDSEPKQYPNSKVNFFSKTKTSATTPNTCINNQQCENFGGDKITNTTEAIHLQIDSIPDQPLKPQTHSVNKVGLFVGTAIRREAEYKSDAKVTKKRGSRRDSQISMTGENKKRVAKEALNAGLVLTTGRRYWELEDFFTDKQNTWVEDLYGCTPEAIM